MLNITEIVTMKTVQDITTDDFTGIVDCLERNFHSRQEGFLDTELLYDEKNGVWIMIQHWDSMAHLKAASKKIFQDPAAASFVKSLLPASVKMQILPQIKTWKNDF